MKKYGPLPDAAIKEEAERVRKQQLEAALQRVLRRYRGALIELGKR